MTEYRFQEAHDILTTRLHEKFCRGSGVNGVDECRLHAGFMLAAIIPAMLKEVDRVRGEGPWFRPRECQVGGGDHWLECPNYDDAGRGYQCEVLGPHVRHRVSDHTIAHNRRGNGFHCSEIAIPIEELREDELV